MNSFITTTYCNSYTVLTNATCVMGAYNLKGLTSGSQLHWYSDILCTNKVSDGLHKKEKMDRQEPQHTITS